MEPLLYNERKINRLHPAKDGVEVRATKVLSVRMAIDDLKGKG